MKLLNTPTPALKSALNAATPVALRRKVSAILGGDYLKVTRRVKPTGASVFSNAPYTVTVPNSYVASVPVSAATLGLAGGRVFFRAYGATPLRAYLTLRARLVYALLNNVNYVKKWPAYSAAERSYVKATARRYYRLAGSAALAA